MSDAYQITIKATDNTWEVFRGRHHVRTRPVKSKKTGALAEAIMVCEAMEWTREQLEAEGFDPSRYDVRITCHRLEARDMLSSGDPKVKKRYSLAAFSFKSESVRLEKD